MIARDRAVQWGVWGVLGLVIGGILLAFVFTRERDVGQRLPVYGEVGPFALTNQLGQVITDSSLKGRIWVADVIFTRCPGPCAHMTRQMRQVQQRLPADSEVTLVSLTVDPDYDSPSVLERYAKRFDADFSEWHFLTGSKDAIYDLAVGSLKLGVEETAEEARQSGDDLFIHSTKFVLLDPRGRVRGYFDGAEPTGVDLLLEAIAKLEKEF